MHINVEKAKSMKNGQTPAKWQLKIKEQTIDCVDEFCSPGSLIANTSDCDKEIRTHVAMQTLLSNDKTVLRIGRA